MELFSHALIGIHGASVALKKPSHRELLLAAVVSMIPDMDLLFLFFLDPVAKLYFHRSLTHSLLCIVPLALIAALLLRRKGWTRRRILGLIVLPLILHLALDCLTPYGTRVLFPLWKEGIHLNLIYVFDPLITLVLLVPLLLRKRRWYSFRLSSSVTLALFSTLVLLSFTLKTMASHHLAASLPELDSYHHRELIPLPGTFLMWHLIAEKEGMLLETYVSPLTQQRTTARRLSSAGCDRAVSSQSLARIRAMSGPFLLSFSSLERCHFINMRYDSLLFRPGELAFRIYHFETDRHGKIDRTLTIPELYKIVESYVNLWKNLGDYPLTLHGGRER